MRSDFDDPNDHVDGVFIVKVKAYQTPLASYSSEWMVEQGDEHPGAAQRSHVLARCRRTSVARFPPRTAKVSDVREQSGGKRLVEPVFR